MELKIEATALYLLHRRCRFELETAIEGIAVLRSGSRDYHGDTMRLVGGIPSMVRRVRVLDAGKSDYCCSTPCVPELGDGHDSQADTSRTECLYQGD